MGVDLSYTCAKCIRFHARAKSSIVDDMAQLAQSFEDPYDTRLRRSRSGSSVPQTSPPLSPQYGRSWSSSPVSVGSTLTPCDSPRAWDHDYQVIVSQYHNQKLHSVCSLLGDYLECVGGAIVLMDGNHVWVLAHKGLRTSSLHTAAFLAVCQRAMDRNESFTMSQRQPNPLDSYAATSASHDGSGFHFFGAAPISSKNEAAGPLGCIVAMDVKSRDDGAAKKVQKTLENLARLVMNLLVEEKTILRIYSSGDFKIFAANGMDLAPTTDSSFQRFGVAPGIPLSPKPPTHRTPSRARSRSQSSTAQISRSKSLEVDGEFTFFSRYANDIPPSRSHANSNPEPHRPRRKTSNQSAPKAA